MSIFKEQELYWASRFEDDDVLVHLPYCKIDSRHADERQHLDYIYKPMSAEVCKQIKSISRNVPMAIYTILLTGVQCLLYKYTNETKMIMGMRAIEEKKSDLSLSNKVLLLKNHMDATMSFKSAFNQMKVSFSEAVQHQQIPFRKMVERLNIQYDSNHVPMIHTLVSLGEAHNLPTANVKAATMFHFDLEHEAVCLKLVYDAERYDRDYMIQAAEHLDQLLAMMLNRPDLEISQVEMLSAAQRNKLLFDFNDTRVDYPQHQSMHQLFEEQVERTPDHPAVIFENRLLTYRELNQQSNRLARTLQDKGVQTGQFVGIMAERSLEMIVGLFGILKAGGAYVPIDPEYPADRIQFILEDSNAAWLLHHGHIQKPGKYAGTSVLLDAEAHCNNSHLNIEHPVRADELAYMIYTSGTTGNPKGVMIEHASIVNSLQWKSDFYRFSGEDRVLMLNPFVFDSFITHFFGPIISGSTVYLLNRQQCKDAVAINSIIKNQEITHIQSPPSFLMTLLEQAQAEDWASIKNVVAAGEKIVPSLIQRLNRINPRIEVCNEYGPTENSVVSTILSINSTEQHISIGKPIANNRVYILGEHHELQPAGVQGELCVAGPGLARGYLNRPDLTAERFVDDPFVPGARMYKTGDFARWLPDGNIEYIGRMDHQEKIRGYRIELGEVEAALLNITGIQEAVVIAIEDETGTKQLCAYVVGADALNVAELREGLSRQLPNYMIPSYFVQLDQMPLTSNGKTDRKALPSPKDHMLKGTEYEAPRTILEQQLASIWEAVLGVQNVGLLDNFFELGGDSIKSIQVSSRLYQAGYQVQMDHLFKNPTIASLISYVQPVSTMSEQGTVTGKVLLTPIQHWFFEQYQVDLHHYNQSIMLHRPEGFQETILCRVFDKMVEHHDALRMVYHRTEQGYEAWNQGLEQQKSFYTLEVMDFKSSADPSFQIAKKANELQRSLSLEQGPLMRLCVFQCADGDHLLIVIHHMVIDGVSWRILIEDLSKSYEQFSHGKEIQLPQKTASFQLWAEQLQLYADSDVIKQELQYWSEMEQTCIKPLQTDFKTNVALKKDSEELAMEWTVKETQQLLKHANRAYNTEINDLLLSALGMSIRQWTGMEEVLVNLEAHGREDIMPNLDLTRTVGWFTSQYPVVLDMKGISHLSQVIKTNKEILRSIPKKGIGYGVLRYISTHGKEAPLTLNPEISFNYLGQFDQDLQHSGMQISPYSGGAESSGDHRRNVLIDVNAMIVEGRLSLSWKYSRTQFRKETMERVSVYFKNHVNELMKHCMIKEKPELTPSDLSIKGMTIEELEGLVREAEPIGEIEDIYALSPMQNGMLFHNMLHSGSEAYVLQTTLDLHGLLDVDAFARSLDQLIERNAILRTNFHSRWKHGPLQIVYRHKPNGLYYEDLRDMKEEDRYGYVAAYTTKDKMKGFDLSKDALMRISILQTHDRTYRFIWNYHHILMDGWCLSLVIQELFDGYFAILEQRKREQQAVTPYKHYIEWLDKQDHEASLKYWSHYLQGYEEQTSLPKEHAIPKSNEYHSENLICTLSQELTERITQVASQNQVTLNTFMQTAWGMLLQKYNSSQDVVFGSVVSGRPAAIAEVERMIGLFINTIPVRIQSQGNETFSSIMKRNQEQAVASHLHETFPLYEIQAETKQKQNLIDHILIFENYPVQGITEQFGDQEETSLRITNVEADEQTNYDFNLIIKPGQALKCMFYYNANVYDRAGIERIQGHLIQLLQQVVNNPHVPINDIDLMTAQEKAQILVSFNDTKAEYPIDKTIHGLFEEQVERTPEQVAVVFEGQELTYQTLNRKANQLARTLHAKGVQQDQLVGIIADRSLDMVVGIVAILKAGGAYVPIDPEYPEDRVNYMLADSGIHVLLLQSHLQERISFAGEIICLDDLHAYHKEDSNLGVTVSPTGLAYVIYTSGTTGKPKGTCIEHKNVVRLLFNSQNRFDFKPSDTWTLFHSFCFDFSVWEMYGALLYGGKLVIVPQMTARSPQQFLQLLRDEQVTILNQTPTYFYHLLQEELASHEQSLHLRKVIFGGEALNPALLKNWREKYPFIQLINMYGITETTVHVTYKEITETEIEAGKSNIGKPIPTLQTYILNTQQQLQPIGVQGELYVAGEGLARGYLNRPELTAEKFVGHAWITEGKLYRTGDAARWLPDGNIEYLGRIDHQVKIRGYRIELGEVETAILKMDMIQEAVVIAHENEDGSKQLCAYWKGSSALTAREIRAALAHEIPDYMIPSYFVQLEHIPLTSNGKIDRKALPSPQERVDQEAEYAAAQSPVEQAIISAWEAVLGVQKISRSDHFFELGGDSIKCIQVASRLLQSGYKVEMKHFFTYPTVAELSEHVTSVSTHYDQGEVTGEVMLTPVQRWFFDQNMVDAHHYNQEMVFFRKDRFDIGFIHSIMNNIVKQHDALRIVYRQSQEGGYSAWNRGAEEEGLYSLDIFDLKSSVDPATLVGIKAKEIQSSLDLHHGPLIKLGLFQCADGDHLLMAIHHLVIDGVSWRILYEDIQTGLEQFLRGEQIHLPQKTTSFKQWAEELSAFADQPVMKQEYSYWQSVEQIELAPLPMDMDCRETIGKDSETITIHWTAGETEQLLKQIHYAYKTEINDILLTALGMAVHDWTGKDKILVNLEGHGRENILPELDITRTVGWFTSMYPVVINMEAGASISRSIKSVKEGLRQIPNKGIGYGILRYLSQRDEGDRLVRNPEISFNYMGQVNQDSKQEGIQFSTYSSGPSVSENNRRPFVLNINGIVIEGRLSLSISYSQKQYQRETMEQLACYYKDNLRKIMQHCITKVQPELTPSDLSLKALTMDQWDQMVEYTRNIGQIENVYPLTPLQKEMLYESERNPVSGAYFVQILFDMRGDLHVDSFERSLNQIMQRHAILRTNFYTGLLHIPLQIVYKEKEFEFKVEDITDKSELQRQTYVDQYIEQDQIRGFDLQKDSLMRMSVIRTAREQYRVIWSFHHILMDGWCMSLISKEIFENYFAIRENRKPEMTLLTPYSHFIEWLEQQNNEAAITYWSRYLEGYEGQTRLPGEKTKTQHERQDSRTLNCHLHEALVQQMKQIAEQQQVTLHTFVQTVWGVLLQQYNQSKDVVFGSVVSGRPPVIPGIESMIGLFINAIPVRIRAEGDESFIELMKKTQAQAVDSHAYDTYSLYDIQNLIKQKQALINHVVVYQNFPVQNQLQDLGRKGENPLEITNVGGTEHNSFDFTLIVIPHEQMKIMLKYNSKVYDITTVEQIQKHFIAIIKQVVMKPEVPINELDLMTLQRL
ncbi:non-ribosomal peptide synthetase [Paenibacillus silvae]|uniref:non-ribosomal peptide synthetase n=1 Tax=Paenibacillus silvae TaxID=1325358 RepID=UPI002002F371|nr:non-ribosomal peptide synthetase [Paenibacillus silvae]MCK6076527.1 amino acid adenylation domain-containing protein [Paenibacillus silvae]MCK6150954.1 amino acid adenylation domain-containing protein [Paenibacillus silvae]MCK6269214.1 amino acid adenylation domain-containing protein [Paenibacillus silvae]